MENWGIISVKFDLLCNDKKTTPSELYQRISRTIAHEVSHMWFGNLVTMDWWDDIWLNEGFARYAEHQILNKLRPEFKVWDKYMEQVYKSALNSDKVLS
jgi:aminopeptidase N